MRGPTNSLHPLFVAFLKDLIAHEFPKFSDTLPLKATALLLSRSGICFTFEESSHRASLMAGGLPLGPSDVPCPVETSTAHGELFLWETVSYTGKDTNRRSFASDLDHGHRQQPSLLHSPEMIHALQISSQLSASRRIHSPSWPATEKLGFPLVGLISIFGPLFPKRPKPINYYQTSNANKPRSFSLPPLSSLRQCLCRFTYLYGRGLHEREKSPSLLRLYFHHLQILELVSFMVLWYDYKSLKIYGLVLLTPFCWCLDCDLGMSNDHSPSSSSNVLKQCSIATIAITRILCYKEYSNLYRSDLNLPLWDLKQNPLGYKTVVSKILAHALLWVVLFALAIIMTLILSSTSQRLLTVTILSSIDLLEDDVSINRDLTCAKPLASICLKALMEVISIYTIYLFMALGNAFPCNVLNFGIFESFSLYLDLI